MAGRPKRKAGGHSRADFAGGGSGGTGRGHPTIEEIHFKHDLPHDIESNSKKIQLQNFTNLMVI